MASSPRSSAESSYKVVILGSGRVGKTSLLLKYVRGTFSSGQISTINAQFLEKRLTHEGQTARLHIWDTAGQEVFKAIAPIYYRKAAAALLVFDVTDAHTFAEAVAWVRELEQEKALVVLVGNKCDMGKSRGISEAEVRTRAQELGLHCYYTSAKTGAGVEDLFTAVCAGLLKRDRLQGTQGGRPKSRKTLRIEEKRTKSEGNCC